MDEKDGCQNEILLNGLASKKGKSDGQSDRGSEVANFPGEQCFEIVKKEFEGPGEKFCRSNDKFQVFLRNHMKQGEKPKDRKDGLGNYYDQ